MKTEIIKQTMPNGEFIEIINIYNGDDCVSMLKSVYDEQQADAKAPKVVDETTPL